MRCNQGAARVQELSSQVYDTCVQEDDNQRGVLTPQQRQGRRGGVSAEKGQTVAAQTVTPHRVCQPRL